MYLPDELREHLRSMGLEPPPNGSEELSSWLSWLKENHQDAYWHILRFVSQSTPETEVEKAQRKAQVAGRIRSISRRHLTKVSTVGDRILNVKLLAILAIAGVVGGVVLLGVLSGSRPTATREVERPREAVAPSQLAPQAGPLQGAAPSQGALEPRTPRREPPPVSPRERGAGDQPVILLPGLRGQEGGQAPSQATGTIVPQLPVTGGGAGQPLPPAPPGLEPVSSQRPQASPGLVVYEARRRDGAAGSTAPAVFVVGPDREAVPGSDRARVAVYERGQREENVGAAGSARDRGQVSASPAPSDGRSEEGALTGDSPVASVVVGAVLDGVLQTGIVTYDGAPVPVLVRTGDLLWVGAASLQGERVQVALDRLVAGKQVYAVRAVLLDGADRSPGLAARITTRGADAAQALLSGAVQGVAQYMQDLASEGKSVVTNGSWAVITQNRAGPWWSYILGGVAGQVASTVPRPQSQVVRMAEVRGGGRVAVLVLSGPEVLR